MLGAEEVLSALDLGVGNMWAERGPSPLEVGEVRESFFEEDGPFNADVLEEDCLKELFVDID